MADREHVIVIATPLEAEHVATIRAAAPANVELVYEPELLAPTRYVADHRGVVMTITCSVLPAMASHRISRFADFAPSV